MVHMANANPGSDQVSSATPTHATISPSRLGHETRSRGPRDGITYAFDVADGRAKGDVHYTVNIALLLNIRYSKHICWTAK